MPVTNQGASNLVVPNVYVDVVPPQQSVAPYVNTSVIAFVGGGNWGPVDQPTPTGGAASIFSAFGNDTVSTYSLVNEMLNALTEDGNGIGVRATDGTDTAATIALPDASAGVVLTLTALYTGSLPNGNAALTPPVLPASARIDLVSGASGASPLFRVTIFFPGAAPEVFNNIVGYSTAGGAYSHTVFQANALAAINGTAPNSVGSQRWVATAGASTLIPVLATPVNATGGADGTSSLAITNLLGSADTLTGMNALAGTPCFQLVICNMNNLEYVPTISEFCAANNIALGFATVPKGTSDATAYTSRLTNAATDGNMVLVKDYILIYDSVLGTTAYRSPLGKAAGIIGLLGAWESPINEPYNTTGNGAANVIGTEQSAIGPRSQDALAALITNGFIAITNQIPLANGTFGIFDDVTAAGSPVGNSGVGNYIPVVRMNGYLSQAFVQLGGQFVGKTQSIQPSDPLRAAVRATYNNFLSSLAPNGGTQQIDEWSVTCDLTNNSPTSIAQGYCYVSILVRFLGIVRIFYVTLQGGTNVTVSNTPPATV